MNETSHRQVFGCGCESPKNYEAHYNNDGDDLCDACGYDMQEHSHSYETYQDEFGHGWAYTCGCMTPPNFALHHDGDGDGKCDDCEYEMSE